MRDTPLTVEVANGQLCIRIGVDTLKWAAEHMDSNLPFDDDLNDFIRLWKIEDPLTFAKDVLRALMDEREDGSTKLTALLDAVCLDAIEDGSTAVTEYGQKCDDC